MGRIEEGKKKKAMVVATVWGTKCIQFLAALAILHQDDEKKRRELHQDDMQKKIKFSFFKIVLVKKS